MNQSIDDRMNPNPGRVKNKGCESCKTIKFCMNSWLDKNAVDAVERIMKRKVFSAGRKIYRRGNPSQSFYVVQSGTVKVERILGDGRHYVHGFYHSGDVFGIESFCHQSYCNDATALDDTQICAIERSQFELLSATNPQVQKMISQLISSELRLIEKRLIDRHLDVEKQLLIFLHDLTKRCCESFSEDRRFSLPMSQYDIASYLGVRHESVCRALKKMQRQGVIQKKSKNIEIINIDNALSPLHL
ncbi:Crp/Fnr family transcriptional regulator [Solemya velum gill symbiont]|uniref:Crp/Fnr family transcriptional regulator n=2 Tax=Solemya velum gill symbiont TaxID=2340 RepID=UPI000996084B|nr:Crp/Fnr family transcriptional regulator [Solemya velum gill symbiont]OOZ44742.1 hypothetical protein BOW37_05535 [Solemya velum gill symbiont]OOZ51816.1 hypothetical protein BOW40_05595 [Solemya velum gill symbiont]OOZ61229.1 hypothetical protein BOW44_08805 [Solemya velum gill symbiont]OOZ65292.1 hypothetical protein BOW45_02485 [Solemya velum gill symbiont]